MNRYLSTVGLYARWNLYKILTIILITALAAGFLVYRYPIGTVVLDENYVSAERRRSWLRPIPSWRA